MSSLMTRVIGEVMPGMIYIETPGVPAARVTPPAAGTHGDMTQGFILPGTADMTKSAAPAPRRKMPPCPPGRQGRGYMERRGTTLSAPGDAW